MALRTFGVIGFVTQVIVTTGLMASCATTEIDREPTRQDLASLDIQRSTWVFTLPMDKLVDYRGIVDFDQAGIGGRGVVYPAGPGGAGLAAGLAIGIITHGLISGSAQRAQRESIRGEADKVLSSYESVLAGFRNEELMKRGIEKLKTSGNVPSFPSTTTAIDAEWVIDSTPFFSMTQDESAIVVTNAVQIAASGNPATPHYRNTVKIVSTPIGTQEPRGYWIANDGEALKDHSASLFAASIELAFVDAARKRDGSGDQKTFRFREGKAERMERGELVSAICNRITIRNLRGWVISVPSAVSNADRTPSDDCGTDRHPLSR